MSYFCRNFARNVKDAIQKVVDDYARDGYLFNVDALCNVTDEEGTFDQQS